MNTRLEIASRAMAGVLFDHNSIGDYEGIANEALAYADALIKLEADSRPEPFKIAGTLADYAKDVSDALTAYRMNPSSKTGEDLKAAQDAMQRYIDKMRGGGK